MKKIFTILTALCFIAVTGTAAQPNNREDWKQKMMNEKIAFLTTELNITPEEGQVFWPVYNKVNQEKDAAMRNVFKAYRNLAKATEEGVKGKELEKLLKEYLNAQQAQREVEEESAEKFMKVLSTEKTAKLYLAEERFRRRQIHKLNHGNNHRDQQK
jgi:Spy/CpxP family protein refolding chaperone